VKRNKAIKGCLGFSRQNPTKGCCGAILDRIGRSHGCSRRIEQFHRCSRQNRAISWVCSTNRAISSVSSTKSSDLMGVLDESSMIISWVFSTNRARSHGCSRRIERDLMGVLDESSAISVERHRGQFPGVRVEASSKEEESDRFEVPSRAGFRFMDSAPIGMVFPG
jgi:hypothetical protein